jgi:glyoxylate reductase
VNPLAKASLRVLVLGDVGSVHWLPWGQDVLDEVGRSHEATLVDRHRPVEEQVAAADVVIDLGGEASPTLARSAAAAGVRLWQWTSVGYDHYDLDSLLDRGVPVANCPGATSASGLAELALMLAMMVLRRYHEVDGWMRGGKVGDPTGRELRDGTLLVIGLGASGRELVTRARAFGMKVVAVRRSGADDALATELGLDYLAGLEELDELLPAADVVSLHVPLAPDTRGLLSAARLQMMPRGSIVVNVSRGGLIDEAGLLKELESGRLAGAGLDVLVREPMDPSDPLLRHPRVVVTPHIAGQTAETSLRRARFAAANVERVAAGLVPLSPITRASGHRQN